MTGNQPLLQNLLNDLWVLIGQFRQQVAVVINAEITRLYSYRQTYGKVATR